MASKNTLINKEAKRKEANIEKVFFINEKTGRTEYNKQCKQCKKKCKQSYRVEVAYCPHYESRNIRAERVSKQAKA